MTRRTPVWPYEVEPGDVVEEFGGHVDSVTVHVDYDFMWVVLERDGFTTDYLPNESLVVVNR